MNLRFVQAFVRVAEEKSIAKVAGELFLTQSAVSSRLGSLEAELGAPLLQRRGGAFELTAAGGRFYAHAKRLLALQEEARRAVGSAGEEAGGQAFLLRLGCIETVLHTWLAPLVERLKEQHPGIEFELNVETTAALNKRLGKGGLDLVFAGAPALGQGVEAEALPPMAMALAGPAGAGRMDWEALRDWELLTFQRGSQPHEALSKALKNAGLGGKRVHAISSIAALAKLAESGFGLATLPRAAAAELARRHALAVLETDLKLPPLPLYASHRPAPAAPLAAAVADALAFSREAAAA